MGVLGDSGEGNFLALNEKMRDLLEKVQGSKCDKASESLTEDACTGEWKEETGRLS